MSNLIMTFYNNSSTEWQPDEKYKQLEEGGNSIETWPDGPLMAYSGMQTCNITQNLSKLDVGPAYFYYCWNNGKWRFGVQIIAHLQVLDMGDRPSWQVMSDQHLNSSTINWFDNGSSPGDQYTWPTTIGYNIMATPDSHHNALSIKIVIND